MFAVANIIIQAASNSLGTVVMAASSAAFNIEIIAYYVLNSFSQACATFTGQNYGANGSDAASACLASAFWRIHRHRGTIAVVLFFGHSLLALFDATPEVISVGYTRLVMVFSAYTFSMLYEVMSGISARLRHLTGAGAAHRNRRGRRAHHLDRVRVPRASHVRAIMIVYPISLAATAVLIGIALLCYRPSKRFAVKP